MFLFEMESAEARAERLTNIVERVLHRLGDSAQKIWSYDEIESRILHAAREMAAEVRLVWDQAYLECLPPGMNHTGEFEVDYITDEWDYGIGSYSLDDEAALLDELFESDEVRRANHTSPDDLFFMEDGGASTVGEAVVELPETLTDVDRALWDGRGIPATTARRSEMTDARYELTSGEVYTYTFEKDGPNALRRIRVPASIADIYYHSGTWGIARDIDDVTDEGVDGTWGIPRQFEGEHPIGDTEGWGLPRRFYQDGLNMRVEYFRTPSIDTDMRGSELPNRYFLYLADFAQWHALKRNGAGQNLPLADLYRQRWERNLARIKARLERTWKQKTHVLGGHAEQRNRVMTRPRLPWQFGATVR